MGRTNIDIDDELLERAMSRYGFDTKKEAVNYALERLVGRFEPRDMLEMEGTGWDGDLDELRRDRQRGWIDAARVEDGIASEDRGNHRGHRGGRTAP